MMSTSFILMKCFRPLAGWCGDIALSFICPNLNKDVQIVLLQRQFTSACLMEESILNSKVVSHHQWGGGGVN